MKRQFRGYYTDDAEKYGIINSVILNELQDKQDFFKENYALYTIKGTEGMFYCDQKALAQKFGIPYSTFRRRIVELEETYHKIKTETSYRPGTTQTTTFWKVLDDDENGDENDGQKTARNAHFGNEGAVEQRSDTALKSPERAFEKNTGSFPKENHRSFSILNQKQKSDPNKKCAEWCSSDRQPKAGPKAQPEANKSLRPNFSSDCPITPRPDFSSDCANLGGGAETSYGNTDAVVKILVKKHTQSRGWHQVVRYTTPAVADEIESAPQTEPLEFDCWTNPRLVGNGRPKRLCVQPKLIDVEHPEDLIENKTPEQIRKEKLDDLWERMPRVY